MNSAQNPTYDAALAAKFASAARHSRLVRILRVWVPATVVVAMAVIIYIAFFNKFRIPELPLTVENMVVSGTKITMESPHLSGFTPDQRPYELWAKTATQDITDPDHVELHTLRAKVLMEDQTTVTMDARTGLFDTKTQILDLHKDIFLQSSTGYEARLTHALVDMAQGTVTSEQPVDVKLLNGTLTADRMKVTEKGDVVRFEDNVVMHLIMDHPLTTTPASEEPAPPPPPVTTERPRARAHKRGHTSSNTK